ncbi:MAG: NrdH-redoxin [Nitrosomonas sp.]|nr:NrdH-redoxin [Nitrosomonas sp.]OQW83131.1 MAG: NrdH-redoxin [Proteobacteria bacterium ST_bin16]
MRSNQYRYVAEDSYSSLAVRCFLFILLLFVQAVNASSDETKHTNKNNVLEVFVRDGCPHCAKAKEFLSTLGSERPWLRIVYYSVDHDPKALNILLSYSQKASVWPPGVPTFQFNGELVVGFDSPDHTGSALAALVDGTRIVSGNVETSLFGTLNVTNQGLPLFTLTMGLLDGFNPCAMWVLLFLLSLLVHLQDRKKMALIAGTFVLASGVVYYAFMAAWLNIFLLIGFSTTLRWVLSGLAFAIGGLNIKDFFAWKRGLSLTISDSSKPGLYARMRAVLAADKLLPSIVAVATLAVLVNFIELLCTAGFPAIYTAILAQQDLNLVSYYAYLGLYILGYVADDTLMVAVAVIALSNHKLTEQTGRWLKLISGVVMLGLGCILILQPELLN